MNNNDKAQELINQLSLAEKASLTSGKNFWYLKGIDRLGLPEVMITDGPHGLRKQLGDADHLGLNTSVPAVSFPTAAATACSFDPQLLYEMGVALGQECRQEDVAVLLGPGINIKRSPLCGRNFEYFSEDPYLTGEVAAAFVRGVQSQQVGTSLKHFAANNQETRRMTSDSVLDERTLREIYLPAFEKVVKDAHPWTVMSSYNRLFGEFASQNERLLTSILRDEWGFEGLVVSDWGAVVDRVLALQAGLDLQMPAAGILPDLRVAAAVREGDISEETLDRSALRVIELILKALERVGYRYDVDAHRTLASRIAAQSAVLLKNEGGLLPLQANQKIAVIGEFAQRPRYQGAGSSKMQPIRVDAIPTALDQRTIEYEYASGYNVDSDLPQQDLVEEACRVARGKDAVLIFAGLPDRYEAEAYDRQNMRMPENHNVLIEAVSRVNKNVVVILMGGSPMEVPWADQVPAILLMYLGGEAVAGACVALLYGEENPSGKLAESWPLQLEDNPSFEYFPGYALTVEYREGLFVGYRYYDTAKKQVRFPFGFGLSYTHFAYHDMRLSATGMADTDELTVSCTITNPGMRTGKETVQLYVSAKDSVIIRPEQELRGFQKVDLRAGESKLVQFRLKKRDFAYYNTGLADWHVESGRYEIRLGASSRDIRLSQTVAVKSTQPAALPDMRKSAPAYYHISQGINIPDDQFEALLVRSIPPRVRIRGGLHTLNSTITDIQDRWLGRQVLNRIRKQSANLVKDDPEMQLMLERIIMDMPLRMIAMMSAGSAGGMTTAQVEGLVEMLNGRYWRGLRKFRTK